MSNKNRQRANSTVPLPEDMDDGVTAGGRHIAREIVDEANDTWDTNDVHISNIMKFSFCTEIHFRNDSSHRGTTLNLGHAKKVAQRHGYKVTDMMSFGSGTVGVEIRPDD